ncbi:ribose transport system ATP-binding protein [Arthrobacter stackebrandtii]|uniref:Ribose transport system ATP-binding protein n=1 Tax=Arthrobacter stackebrandtii TaxID=272161 RepID=A0ABS4YTS4_9MICC|nr:sugar ABC transporter ATP-binding protein [Arthrobacter stackebrandtii]MBP2411792.1 ribose transport system ATP-binding protein [Arthrobacter stackebrandtii]PYG99184.1 ABC transporter permease [Arthrobacter stackebrandtii]
MSAPILQASNVTKTYPGVKALDNVNLTLMPGEVHALLGENGAGKSTLIKYLTGVHQADSGTLLINGVEEKFTNPSESGAAGVGVVHQERNVIREFTVAENIVLSRTPKRFGFIDWKKVNAEASRCLALLDFEIDPQTPIAQLSSAQIQLVEIARALYTETKVLLLDEPTASISDAEAAKLFTVIHRLKADGAAILFVSHKLDEVYAHCDTVTVLRDGKTVLSDAALADHPHDEIVNIMVGRSLASLVTPERAVDQGQAPVLEMRNVTTTAGHGGISLEVRPGEILGLYGLVGAGRTELAHAILGRERITEGELLVNGSPAVIHSVRDALHTHGIGYVTESRKEEGVFLEQNITRNVAVTSWGNLAGPLGMVRGASERSLVEKYVAELDIKISSQDQLAGQLSGGNQQKVSLAKWLAADPRILIIDEPTIGIDVRTKRSFYELIWGLADQGLAILLISSDLAEMITLADRIAVMDSFTLSGTVDNSHDYDTMSQDVIRLIHNKALA